MLVIVIVGERPQQVTKFALISTTISFKTNSNIDSSYVPVVTDIVNV